ncbi:uncharacterized protein LOC125226810 [Leguminivora glycinivorella]|uniref:uncharacterized protein LOC125225861 n=1 Tax=Leguminivora glycinivorella TaxID=1035111 RepID=UPI002010AE02|nr:uncharacterized protein LOC125225861 [Leguminivora glycinivorella]XP_047986873.1 uncharacterized protein LOC125226810 [Leguminivora glycinivorella]
MVQKKQTNQNYERTRTFTLHLIVRKGQKNRFLRGGGMMFQHLVALYLKLPRKAAVACRGVISCILQVRTARDLRVDIHDSFSKRYKGDLCFTMPKRRLAR